jgi:hypothetical protein
VSDNKRKDLIIKCLGKKSRQIQKRARIAWIFLQISRFSTVPCWHSVPTYIFKCFVVPICFLTIKERTYYQKFRKKSSGPKNEPELQEFFIESLDFWLFRAGTLSQFIFLNVLLLQYVVWQQKRRFINKSLKWSHLVQRTSPNLRFFFFILNFDFLLRSLFPYIWW